MASRLTGNQFWRLRTKHGKPRLFGDPKLLIEEACAYFDWCDRHPWEKAELVKYKGSYEEASVPLGRPYSMDGLTCYLRVSGGYFRVAKKELGEKIEKKIATDLEAELLEAIQWIEQTIRTQQIEGAAVGVFSPSLVARINGISDNVNVNNNQPVIKMNVIDDDTRKYADELADLL